MEPKYFFNYLRHVVQLHRKTLLNCYFENSMNDLQISVGPNYFKIFKGSKVLHVLIYLFLKVVVRHFDVIN
jgi:hypothetical protein